MTTLTAPHPVIPDDEGWLPPPQLARRSLRALAAACDRVLKDPDDSAGRRAGSLLLTHLPAAWADDCPQARAAVGEALALVADDCGPLRSAVRHFCAALQTPADAILPILLPVLLQHLLTHGSPRTVLGLARLARDAGFALDTPLACALRLIEEIIELRDCLGLPDDLRQLGIDQPGFLAARRHLAGPLFPEILDRCWLQRSA
jgi:alcohol dehydrogenase class IV